jgi:nitroimidazol reductase NimA-like FMN-containing flavoprotein (pyridoxamine 5'-phosphate oxidase superfamily)
MTRPSERARVRRLPKRGHYDAATLHAILDAGLVCHVGYVIDGQPYVTPTAYWRHGATVYFHGSSASRLLRHAARGVPVCLTVTHLDGLVLARSGFHHSLNYRSAMLFGTATPISDPAAKAMALDRFIERVAAGRAAALRPARAQEQKATTVLRLAIEEASAKIRTGPPIDDEPDYALPVWAGVVPVQQVVGPLENDPRLAPGLAPPEHLARFTAGRGLETALS